MEGQTRTGGYVFVAMKGGAGMEGGTRRKIYTAESSTWFFVFHLRLSLDVRYPHREHVHLLNGVDVRVTEAAGGEEADHPLQLHIPVVEPPLLHFQTPLQLLRKVLHGRVLQLRHPQPARAEAVAVTEQAGRGGGGSC